MVPKGNEILQPSQLSQGRLLRTTRIWTRGCLTPLVTAHEGEALQEASAQLCCGSFHFSAAEQVQELSQTGLG